MILTKQDKALFKACVKKIQQETFFEELKAYKHHHHTTTYHHSIAVAYFSFCLYRALGLKCNEEELIYGALLHDYYLYDCHKDEKDSHLTKHPYISLENAKRDWKIGRIEENIIKRHMFPITFIPPKYKESIIVNLVDKGCALYEALYHKPYSKNEIIVMDESYAY